MAKGSKPEYWLCLSDLHCGSTVSLFPPNFKTSEGYLVGHNSLTGWIWECWRDVLRYTRELAKTHKVNVLVNGDLIEGDHHHTVEIWSRDMADHADAAYQSLYPLAEIAERFVVVRGTECHTEKYETGIAEALGGECYANWEETIGGTRVRVFHHMPATAKESSKANGLGTELANQQLAACRAGHQMPRLLIMAHRHVYGWYDDGDQASMATHAWQTLTRYGDRVVRSNNVHIGATLLRFDGGGALPEVAKSFRYRLPAGETCKNLVDEAISTANRKRIKALAARRETPTTARNGSSRRKN